MKKRKLLRLAILLFFCFFAFLYLKEGQKGRGPTEQGKVLDDSIFLQNLWEKYQGEEKEDRGKTIEKNKTVRIVLQNQVGGYYHKKITFTANSAFIVSHRGKQLSYKAGEKVTMYAKDVKTDKKPYTIQVKGSGRIKICTLKKQSIHPSYRGQMKIYAEKAGLVLVNTLSMEQYLYAVVPSEISSGCKMEAMKAQAVCARTYAYNQIKGSRYEKYHADLDDSVACQVYNNVPENRRSRKAVDDTDSMVLTQKGKRIQVYYFSTSWGATASGKSVWNTENDISYLPARYQKVQTAAKEESAPNLASEKAFMSFIRKPPFQSYDTDSPWFRWNMVIATEALERKIEAALNACHQSNPYLILYETKGGGFKKMSYRDIGEIIDIRISKREKSGLVTELIIRGKENSVKVLTQYNIRCVLGSSGAAVNNKNGEIFLDLLPSAAFYIQKGKKDVFYLYGGGFGHGAGMSQFGAMTMAEDGFDFSEILMHYFEGVSITRVEDK